MIKVNYFVKQKKLLNKVQLICCLERKITNILQNQIFSSYETRIYQLNKIIAHKFNFAI